VTDTRVEERPLSPAEARDVRALASRGEHMIMLALPMLRRHEGVTPAFGKDELAAFRAMCQGRGDTSDPALPTRLLRHLVDCLLAGAITVEEIEAKRKTARFRDDLPFIVGAFWGSRVVRATGYEWAMVRVPGYDEATALVSPRRGCMTYPFHLADRILKRKQGNTLQLAYNDIVGDPEHGFAPGAYTVMS
jgi:hypothetical protein